MSFTPLHQPEVNTMLQNYEQYLCTTEILTLTGRFDRRLTSGLQILILLAQQTGQSRFILDFSSTTDIDANSFRRFFRWYRTIKSDQVQVSLVRPRESIWTQFHVWHSSEIVQIFSSLEEATWKTTAYT